MVSKLNLGIDVGTTSVKAGLIDESGHTVSLFVESYSTVRRDGGIVEQNPDTWIALINKAIQRFSAEGHVDAIAGVGLCSQVNTHVFVGCDGKPLMPAIQWQDGRASVEAAELDDSVTDEQKCQWWGAPMPIDASNVLSRMLWVARHEPAIWEKTRWVMLPKDYCLFKLTGQASTDPLSNIGLVDTSLNYISAVFDLVPGCAEKLAPLVPVTSNAGHLVSDSLLAGRPIVSGTMDAWAGLVAAGGARSGSSIYLSGTSEILGISSHKVVPTPGAIVFAENDGIRLHAAPTQSGGDAQLWFAALSQLGLEAMSDLVSNTPRTNATPMFLPQLEGERAPLWNADLRAAFLGVSRRTQLGDMARGVYEGVAFSARYALETLQLSADTHSEYISCGGGGFHSDTWNQIRADVLGVELRTLASGEAGVLGAATMAAIGAGDFSNFEQAHDALASYDRVFVPSTRAHLRYRELFEVYKDAISINAELGARLVVHK